MFQKAEAPEWVEYPLLDGARVLGKLVVDKYGQPQKGISASDVEHIRPYVHFIAKVMKRMPSFVATDKKDEWVPKHRHR